MSCFGGSCSSGLLCLLLSLSSSLFTSRNNCLLSVNQGIKVILLSFLHKSSALLLESEFFLLDVCILGLEFSVIALGGFGLQLFGFELSLSSSGGLLSLDLGFSCLLLTSCLLKRLFLVESSLSRYRRLLDLDCGLGSGCRCRRGSWGRGWSRCRFGGISDSLRLGGLCLDLSSSKFSLCFTIVWLGRLGGLHRLHWLLRLGGLCRLGRLGGLSRLCWLRSRLWSLGWC